MSGRHLLCDSFNLYQTGRTVRMGAYVGKVDQEVAAKKPRSAKSLEARAEPLIEVGDANPW